MAEEEASEEAGRRGDGEIIKFKVKSAKLKITMQNSKCHTELVSVSNEF